MKVFVVIAVVVLALAAVAVAGAAAPSGFTVAARLAPAASFVAGKPIAVYCAATEAAWEQYGGTSQEFGLAVPGSSEIKLSPGVCRYLRAKIVNPNGFGASLLVLVHESIHARGESDEGVTDCAAVHEMPRVAVKFFYVKAGKQLRAVMANAWNYRNREGDPYRTIC